MELEIKVLWCRGLTAFNFFQKLTVYAAVSINSEDERIQLSEEQKQEQKTPVDQEGDGNPEWNYTMYFNLKSISITSNLQNFSLLFEIRNHSQLLRDRNIGEVRVPLKDLIESVGFGVVRFASYEVRGANGKSNGILDFSYKVGGNLGDYNSVCLGSEIQIAGYSDHHHHHHHYHHDSDHMGQSGPSNRERIEYPKVEFEGFSGNPVPSAPPLMGGHENGQFQNYPTPSSATVTATTHYTHPSYPPPGPPLWAPPPPHFPPPPPPRPYGDPYWGYHRPPPEHYYQHSGGGYRNHHW